MNQIASIVVALFFIAPLASAGPATSLVVGEGFTEPLGFHQAKPTFSWKLPVGTARQSAYRIEVTSGARIVWDSQWVKSDRSTFVPYGGAPLISRQQISWRVNFRDEKGRQGGWSSPAILETGVLSAKDWRAKWIRPAGAPAPDREPVGYLRRSFAITKQVKRARLYATARGLFELQLNGQ